MNLQTVLNFLNQNQTCVLATTTENLQPEAATVGFSCDKDFRLMIATNKATRKARNLLVNPKVAVVVGTEGTQTVQIEGLVNEVPNEHDDARIVLHLANVPSAQKYAKEVGQAYFLITPTWLRMTDYTQSPDIFETEDFT